MSNTSIAQTLEKQLQLLSERSEKCDDLDDLLRINLAICDTVQSLMLTERQIVSRRSGRAFKT